MKKMLKGFILAVGILGGTVANAGVVNVWGESASYYLNAINNTYNGVDGHSSSIVTGQLDTINLAGVNLLWAVHPADAYTSAELTTMANFLAGGGRIAFMGEHGSSRPAENTRINAALTALGSTISINNVTLDNNFRTASVADGQILSHALTTGVDLYEYAAFAPISISGSAEALMLGEESYLGNPSIMMAYQNIGPGSIFLITDQNVWDPTLTDLGEYYNGIMFRNLLAVPEASTYGMMLAGLGLVGFAVRRRKQRF